MSEYNYLIDGKDYLARFPDFKLEGRNEELEQVCGVLMRKKSSSVLICGPGGAGASAICMGIEASKLDQDAPLDITSKRMFWLNTDGLFASGDSSTINENYEKLSRTLRRTPESILVVDDFRDFVDAARSAGCSNLINSLMADIKSGKFQAVLETRDKDLDVVLKCHSDMNESFTLVDIPQPDEENLKLIIENTAHILEGHHGIKISPDAIETAIELTQKYRANDASLSRAQPERTLTLLDRALTKYRQKVHSKPEGVDELQVNLDKVKAILAGTLEKSGEFKDKSSSELESIAAALASDIQEVTSEWELKREEIDSLRKAQISGEQTIRDLEQEIEELQAVEDKKTDDLQQNAEEQETKHVATFMEKAKVGGFESDEVKELRLKITKYQDVLKGNKVKYKDMLTNMNSKFLLTKDHVLVKFSRLSGIPVNKLNEDEREKLLTLDKTLSERVYDQNHVIQPLSNAVRAGRVGLRDRNKPQGAFFFLGPSGVGKTELAKALAHSLYGDERALLRIDMSDYQEKHAVAKLIGAPPGYEGFEAGGILTNAMRINPRRIVLFDEVEKGHTDVYDILLQIVDDARLSDNVGRVVSFSDSVVLLTSNIGSEHFLNTNISFETATDLAKEELNNEFRPEFLNRFNGRRNIRSFNRLSHEAIQKIITREIGKWNQKIESRGLSLYMSDEDIVKMCAAQYDPTSGARGPKGYLESYLEGNLSMTILGSPDAKGVMKVTYNEEAGDLEIQPPAVNDVDQENDLDNEASPSPVGI